MMLSDKDIFDALNAGELVVDPMHPDAIRPAGVTLHLGFELLKPRSGIVVDVRNGLVPEYDQIMLAADSPYKLNSGDFVLAATFERIPSVPSWDF